MILVLISFEEGLQEKGFSSNTFICGERKNYDKYSDAFSFFLFHTNATPYTHQALGYCSVEFAKNYMYDLACAGVILCVGVSN